MSTRVPPAAPGGLTGRFARRPLRPLVLLTSGLAAAWGLLSMVGAFRVFAFQNSNNLKHLAPIALALGVVYATVAATQIFGFVAAQTQKLPLIRTYSFLAILGGIGIAATGFIEVVTHFVFRTDLINECADISDGGVVFFGWGFFGPSRSETLNAAQARSFCNSAYSRDNISTVVSLLILCFYGGILAIIGRAFFQQSLDPMFGRTQLAPAYGMSNFPPQPQGGYVPPPGPPAGFAPPQGGFAPPAGPPPSGFAPPPGPPPMGAGYGYGAGSSQNPFADQKEMKTGPDAKDDPFADFERIPDAERDIVGTRPAPGGRERFDV